MSIKKNIKKIIPPLFLESYHSLVSTKNNNVSWTGNYTSWQEAKQHSSGYESSVILETVKNALLKVKNGEAVYERDSVLFDKIQYSFPLLSALMWISSKNNSRLSVKPRFKPCSIISFRISTPFLQKQDWESVIVSKMGSI